MDNSVGRRRGQQPPTLSTIWTPTLTGGPVKIGKVSNHSASSRMIRRENLTSPNGRELDGFKGQRFKSSNYFTFPHFLTSQDHTNTLFSRILVFLSLP
uniref:Putative ovule protein n=1 Tax=Solanum chacoense TaxID=4108 RepID=A0A0V0GNK2_SOLCH